MIAPSVVAVVGSSGAAAQALPVGTVKVRSFWPTSPAGGDSGIEARAVASESPEAAGIGTAVLVAAVVASVGIEGPLVVAPAGVAPVVDTLGAAATESLFAHRLAVAAAGPQLVWFAGDLGDCFAD